MSKFKEKAEAQTMQVIGQMIGDDQLVEEGKEQSRKAEAGFDEPLPSGKTRSHTMPKENDLEGAQDQGVIRQRLSRDGKHFLLGPATDGLIEVMGVVSQRFLSLGAQVSGCLPCVVEEPLTFGFRLVRGLS